MSLDVDHVRKTLALAPAGQAGVAVGNYEGHRRAMLHWFEQQEGRWDANGVILGSLAVFGWMPTILEGRTPSSKVMTTERAELIANSLNAREVEGVPFDFVNNSSVGTSKFLHFWRPSEFPIWDINVSAALYQDDRRRQKACTYQMYRRAMIDIARHDDPAVQASQLLVNEQKLFRLGQRVLPAIRARKKAEREERKTRSKT